jgi:quinoprotein glucose dehydrogenase
MRRYWFLPVLLVAASLALVLLPGGPLPAQDDKADPNYKPYDPKISAASNEAVDAIKRIRVPQGTKVELWAAEPMLANPVAFCVDEHNRFYVAETFRLHAGVTDIRGHGNWLDDDLACRTVADRIAMMKKFEGDKFKNYAVEHDRLRLIEDTKGEGKADKSTVFADGFNHAEDGIAAGVLAWRGKVWFTCIPSLWLLQDTKGTGKADVRKELQTGYGVRVGFLGHDLHGIKMGPDGKLYFSIGDRALHVETEGHAVDCPDTGAVLRCNTDGTGLELFATGLRNPQSLVFDEHGNLFTGDNNADAGDGARWVYIVEGGDSGWRVGYQHMHMPTALGPWNAERLWDPAKAKDVGYIVPPIIASKFSGPSGVAYDPGVTQMPDKYKKHFYLVDFRGGSGGSGIQSFALKPQGASFEVTDYHQAIWSVLAVDVGFGTDGGLYFIDWVEGWGKPNKGRIYKVADPDKAKDAAVAEVKKLLADGFTQRPTAELTKLLEHADMRIRQEAQFALVDKGADAVDVFAGVAKDCPNALARLHAIWGLGQLAAKHPAALKSLPTLLTDKDAEVRSQSAKVLADHKVAAAYDAVLALLKDPEPRVRFFGLMALSKLGKPEAVPAVLQWLHDQGEPEPYLRHAAVMVLVNLHDKDKLLAAAKDDSPAVRFVATVAMRRLGMPEIAGLLDDKEPKIVLEAARAIADAPIDAALPQLASLINRTNLPEPVLYRALAANFRLGKAENAIALAAFAARPGNPEPVRVEALKELAEWDHPSGRDRTVGLWRPLAARPQQEAIDAVRPALGGIFSGPDKLRGEGVTLAAKFGIKEIGPTLLAMATDKKQPVQVRIDTLQALQALKDARLADAVKTALSDDDAHLRAAGRRVEIKLHPEEALAHLTTDLEKGELPEKQNALALLGELNSPDADKLLSTWLDKLLAKEVPGEVQLELLTAAARKQSAEVKQKLTKFNDSRSKTDHLSAYRESLAGGDAENGRRIFQYKAEVQCIRCHKFKGTGGDVGPELAGVGARQNREYLLESIVEPSRQIAKGFETVVITTKKGTVVTGVLKSEDAKEIRLITPEGKPLVVAKDEVDERVAGKSAMPEDIIKSLSKAELRDLVEFLATAKEAWPEKK